MASEEVEIFSVKAAYQPRKAGCQGIAAGKPLPPVRNFITDRTAQSALIGFLRNPKLAGGLR
jgi:hypothetical protein